MIDPENTVPIFWDTRDRATTKKEACSALANLLVDHKEIFETDWANDPRIVSTWDAARGYAKEWGIPFSKALLVSIFVQSEDDEAYWESSDAED